MSHRETKTEGEGGGGGGGGGSDLAALLEIHVWLRSAYKDGREIQCLKKICLKTSQTG